uniref:Uncharacterized protein n=1 Tax=Phage sp. ctGns7 TaxID=2828003 RepID=A0A8S5S9Y6_9VIRU|nr:MAG TPA: hypothetical protein [Phage sp. ctGns7]
MGIKFHKFTLDNTPFMWYNANILYKRCIYYV